MGDVIQKEEYQSWIIFKKNDDELYVAREHRYECSPIFFGFIPRTGEVIDVTDAQALWEDFEQAYNIRRQKIGPCMMANGVLLN